MEDVDVQYDTAEADVDVQCDSVGKPFSFFFIYIKFENKYSYTD